MCFRFGIHSIPERPASDIPFCGIPSLLGFVQACGFIPVGMWKQDQEKGTLKIEAVDLIFFFVSLLYRYFPSTSHDGMRKAF